LYAHAAAGVFRGSLVEAMVVGSHAHGEVPLSSSTRGLEDAPCGDFELLFSTDGGATWNELPPPAFDVLIRQRSILPYPVGIAAAAQQEIVLFGGIDRTGQSWRDAWRWAQ